MSEAKHTPGPWNCVRSLTCGHLRAAHNYQSDPQREWTKADMQLIDAAPELLESLRVMILQFNEGIDGLDVHELGAIAAARAAIRKATGEPQ
jgi:hypothetical protein